jgi:hypothetical protein
VLDMAAVGALGNQKTFQPRWIYQKANKVKVGGSYFLLGSEAEENAQ